MQIGIAYEFSTISSSNYERKYKEWKSLVYHGFVRKIVLLKKSNIPIGFNVKNQVVLLIGNNKRRVKQVIV